MPENILQKILETKRKEVAELRGRVDLPGLVERARGAGRPRNFFSAVTRRPRRKLNLIAEIKKASPSAGVLCENFDPPAIAQRYAAAGADAISVLTDATYFQGSLRDLELVRSAVSLPVLRKDFIIDAFQVYQSRAAGADAILLIAAALPPGQLADLLILATELRMTTVIEVHGVDELMQVRSMVGFPHAAYSVLGINNRDLTTFQVDINNTMRLAELAGEDTPIVSESGIKTAQDVSRLASVGVKAVLVGETLMRSPNVAREIEALLGPEEAQ